MEHETSQDAHGPAIDDDPKPAGYAFGDDDGDTADPAIDDDPKPAGYALDGDE